MNACTPRVGAACLETRAAHAVASRARRPHADHRQRPPATFRASLRALTGGTTRRGERTKRLATGAIASASRYLKRYTGNWDNKKRIKLITKARRCLAIYYETLPPVLIHLEDETSVAEAEPQALHVASLRVGESEARSHCTLESQSHPESPKVDGEGSGVWWRRPVELLEALNPFGAAGGLGPWAPRAPRFHVDRPFLFIVRTRTAKTTSTGTPNRRNSETPDESERNPDEQHWHVDGIAGWGPSREENEGGLLGSWLFVGRVLHPQQNNPNNSLNYS